VGGNTAVNLDVQRAAAFDRNLIIPIVLAVVFVILGLLLRAVLAPLLLIATVVLSFAAAMGFSAIVFKYVFGYGGADTSFPLFVFVFLVALGIDYNIFLMSRVREEAHKQGTRRATLVALAATGGVITSAGLVLAGTFAVLATLPLTAFAEIGFTVAFGVLLDTIVVRSILVTALNLDLGPRIWWPNRLAHETTCRRPRHRNSCSRTPSDASVYLIVRPSSIAIVMAWSASMTAPLSSAVRGSSAVRSLPRRSARSSLIRVRAAPDRSTPDTTASLRFTPVRSASRIRTSRKTAPCRSAPESPTNDQSPPVTVSGRSCESWNALPVSLHPVNSASNRFVRLKWQRRKAESLWRLAFSRTLKNSHSSNRTPWVEASVRSTSEKRHRRYVRSTISSAYQSSFTNDSSSVSTGSGYRARMTSVSGCRGAPRHPRIADLSGCARRDRRVRMRATPPVGGDALTATVRNITFDCPDAYELAQFWSLVTGHPLSDDDNPGDPEASIPLPGGPALVFCGVPEPKR
jgi:hypothetical protein